MSCPKRCSPDSDTNRTEKTIRHFLVSQHVAQRTSRFSGLKDCGKNQFAKQYPVVVRLVAKLLAYAVSAASTRHVHRQLPQPYCAPAHSAHSVVVPLAPHRTATSSTLPKGDAAPDRHKALFTGVSALTPEQGDEPLTQTGPLIGTEPDGPEPGSSGHVLADEHPTH